MSGKASGLVWEMKLPRPLKYLLLAMADHADHDGGGIRPGVELLAWKCEYTARNVQLLLRQLEDLGVILAESPQNGGAGNTTTYRIVFDAVPTLDRRPRKRVKSRASLNGEKGEIPAQAKGEIQCAFAIEKGEIQSEERVKSRDEKGEISSRARTSIPLTVIEPSVESSSSVGAIVENGDDDDDVFASTYRTALGRNWPVAVNAIAAIFPDMPPVRVEAMLGDVERDVGPLSRSQLQDGIEAACESLKLAVRSTNGVSYSKSYAKKVITERLREVANVRH